MQPFSVPALDLARLRGILAERQISNGDFSKIVGYNISYIGLILNERIEPGVNARIRIASACDALGFEGVVTWPTLPDNTRMEASA